MLTPNERQDRAADVVVAELNAVGPNEKSPGTAASLSQLVRENHARDVMKIIAENQLLVVDGHLFMAMIHVIEDARQALEDSYVKNGDVRQRDVWIRCSAVLLACLGAGHIRYDTETEKEARDV